jgi:hypothetical protein
MYGRCQPGMPPKWIQRALKRLEQHIRSEIALKDEFQKIAHASLSLLADRVRRFFALPLEENVGFSLYLPLVRGNPPVVGLHEICSSQHVLSADDIDARRLGIMRGNEQGLPGIAFNSAIHLDVLDDERDIYRNFDSQMKTLWRSQRRDWRSILALPVMDRPTWLPIGVIACTSNHAEPFWTKFGSRRARYQAELFALMQETATLLLGGFQEESNPPAT